MENEFKEFVFPDGKCTYHYLNPSRNVTYKLPLCAEEGQEFFIEGNLDRRPLSFRVEFREDNKDGAPVHFSLHVDIEESEVIFASVHGERKTKKCTAFESGVDFIMRINTKYMRYKVTINKTPPMNYNVTNKDAITKPQYVTISGDSEIRSFHIHQKSPQGREIFITVPGNVQIGDIFTFRGRGPQNGERINISFMDTLGKWDDIWLFLEPRFNWSDGWKSYSEILRNAYVKWYWKTEEKDGGMPLRDGELYKLEVLVEKEHFRIVINENDFRTYKHQLPYPNISKIRISYDTTKKIVSGISSIVMTRINRVTPPGLGYATAKSIAEFDASYTQFFPRMPVRMKIPQPLKVGNCICISAIFKRAERFVIGLTHEQGDKIYEMEADFGNRVIEELLETSSFRDNNQKLKFPFRQNGHFDMSILCVEDGELVISVGDAVMNRLVPYADYRLANLIEISGDIRVKIVSILYAEYVGKDD